MNSNAKLNVIAELDLNRIKAKLMHKESGEGWSREQANAVEFEYRRFLCLIKLFPAEQVAPRFDVDIFWHYHILDTMKYAADCALIFGYFLHHSPDSGLGGENDEDVRHRTGARMQELYEATFGEAYIRQKEGETATTGSQPAQAKTAWCNPTTTAWCNPTVTAWCNPTTTAWCNPTTTAWCNPTTANPAWLKGATPITARPQTAAPNEKEYSRPELAMAA